MDLDDFTADLKDLSNHVFNIVIKPRTAEVNVTL